jgi:hypothetical protein
MIKRAKSLILVAFVGAAALAPSMASADPTLLTILALSAIGDGTVREPTAPQPNVDNVDPGPVGSVFSDIFGATDDPDRVAAHVSLRARGVYHCHRRHHCHTHRR